MPISSVDLFCGAGGLSHGLRMEGIPVNAGVDIDPACRYPFETNNLSPFIEKDVEEVTAAELEALYPEGDIKILAGCAPCQPFSSYNLGRDTSTDKKWGLLYSFARLVKEVRPEIVSMENVPQLIKHEVFDDFKGELEALGYHVTAFRVDCPSYGIPQTRTRLLLFASIYGPIEIVPPTHTPEKYITVRQTIGHLPRLGAGEVSVTDPLHRSAALSERNLKRIRSSRPGGTWRDWDESLIANCHKKDGGKSFGGVYGRMVMDDPSPTMTTQCYAFGSGRFGHPEQDRAITLREAALFQTFPEYYDFIDPDKKFSLRTIGRLIGNAVPVRLGQVVARSILQHMEGIMQTDVAEEIEIETPDTEQEGKTPPYKMSLTLNVLNHLGLNLYSNTAAVLSESVANAWDADAKLIDIKIDRDADKIVITDNGCGMTLDDINNKFLSVGYAKREDGNTKTTSGRQVMGRKGIGKLSLFSIANSIEVHSVKDGEKNGFTLSVPDIKNIIKENKPYYPSSIDPTKIKIEEGTQIILTNLKKKTSHTSAALRKRLARRFSVIGAEHNFEIQLDGEKISLQDRDYYKKIQFFWGIGESEEYKGYCKNLKKADDYNGLLPGNAGYAVSGWIGAVEKPKQLESLDSGNINGIVLLANGRLVQENILNEFNEGRLFTKYLIGEINADFLDSNDMDDIATSNRQKLIEDDPRYSALKGYIHTRLNEIANVWSDWRKEFATASATEGNAALMEWYKSLKPGPQKSAEKLFGKIESLKTDKEEEKKELYKHGILAFEKLRLKEDLGALDNLTSLADDSFRTIFADLNEIEAALYYDIAAGRLEVIRKFGNMVSNNEKEKAIQEYLFDNLWILDPSWERATGSELMEKSVYAEFDKMNVGLTKKEELGRLDIKYRTTAGKHVIVELKRPDRQTGILELIEQGNKYRMATLKCLKHHNRENEQIDIIFVLGKPVQEEETNAAFVEAQLRSINGRITYFNKLIDDSLNAYGEYLDRHKEVERIQSIIDRL